MQSILWGDNMELILSDAKLFRQSIDAMVDLIKDAEFIVNEYGVSLKAIDAAQIAMVVFNMPKDVFEKFDVSGTTKLGVNLPSLSSILKRAKNNDKLALKVKDKRLNVVLSSDNTRCFSINLLDISSNEMPNPDINFDATIKMKANNLIEGVKDAGLFSTYLLFSVDPKTFKINAKGPQGDLENKTEMSSKQIMEKDIKKEATAMFSIEYLQNILKGASSETDIELFIKTNAPLKVKYKISNALLEFFLAPRDYE